MNEKFEVEDETEFLCECGQQTCFETLLLTRAQYEAVRGEGQRFVVVPGHEDGSLGAWSTASRSSSSSRRSGKPARSRRSKTPARRLRRRFAHESPKGLAPQTNPFA
ncbi:MAG TPA: hypothetical protein VN960_05815 [Gaiellaceae bacterium]|nr:hypothetical protein [Gaiellaceae bacterium]